MADLVRLVVPSEHASLSLVEGLAERWCTALEVPPDESTRIVRLVGDVVRYTLEHAYPGDPSGQIELTLDLVGTDVRVDVHDWGLPLASAGGELGALPAGLAELAGRAEDLRLLNLGADGKRISFHVGVSHALDSGPEAHEFEAGRRAASGEDVRERLEIRDATPADAETISQLLYGNYHLSYGHPDFYRPRWVAEQLERDLLLSSLAVLDGEVVGHHAVMLEQGHASAETGAAVVHPAYRGLGIFTVLGNRSLERTRALGLEALWGRAVTVHPYSQRAALARGYRETGVMLGSVPARMEMEGIAGADAGRRTASILSYRMLLRAPRPVTLPPRYAGELEAAYRNIELELAGRASPATPAEPVTASEEDSRATSTLLVSAWDEQAVVHEIRRALARQDVVYLDLDLVTGAATDEAVESLNDRGFFYAGLVVSGRDGHDCLRLQRLNADNIELEQIVADSDAARGILQAVLADRRRVDV
jgi:GNAT superfamily N-acetyltransferase